MGKDELIGIRLKVEREALSLKLQYVAAQLGFNNYQTLSSIESGERPARAWELMKLAQLYGRNMEFFLRPEQLEQQKQHVLWREPAQTEKTALAERKFLNLCDNFSRLKELSGETESDSVTFPITADALKLRKDQFRYVEKLADEYRRLLDLGGRPACALPSALENQLGILVLFLDLADGGSAAATCGPTGQAILVNSSDISWRRNYDLAHEFFHLATWDAFSQTEIYDKQASKSLPEQFADAFASALLLPADKVREECANRITGGKISYASLIEIAREFEVSTDALLWRLVNLRLLARKDVIDTLNQKVLKEMELERKMKGQAGERPYLSARYISLAIKTFLMGKISKAKLAEYVGIAFSEVPSFLKSFGYDEDEDYTVAFDTA
jgi:Zn-dependent peptidase ImmA (M78 family)